MPPAITPTTNGPYRIDGLERLRNSRGEELTDGTHWYVGFRDPRN